MYICKKITMNILRIKEVLLENNLTGKELAERINVTQASVSNIVNGNSFPKPETLLKIAEALDVDVRELFISTKNDNMREPIFIKKDGSFFQIGYLL